MVGVGRGDLENLKRFMQLYGYCTCKISSMYACSSETRRPTSALGSVSQLGEVKVKPLSVPASRGNTWEKLSFLRKFHLFLIAGYEVSVAAEFDARESHKPVGRRNHLGHQGNLDRGFWCYKTGT